MTLQPGQTVAHYRIVKKLGSGGMGEVWAAEDARLKRSVALKVLPSHIVADERIRARFEREAQAIAALNHPNIVTIHSVEETEGVPFLTMELVEGEPLSKRMQRAMPLAQLFSIAIPLADAVAAAHERGILHRDLKPDNIMVTPAGAVKVLDFGLAKLRDSMAEASPEPGSDVSLTREGAVVGTAAYMSPEQAEGKAVGPESDVFALGIILYQLTTGKRPFSGSTAISMISSILKEEPAPVTELNRALPLHLGRIVRRCLRKDPKRRYATARGLRNELEVLQEDLAASASDPEAIPARRPAAWALLATAAALLLMTVVAAVGWMRGDGGGTTGAGTAGARVAQQTFFSGVETNPSLSPNGHFLLYTAELSAGNRDIFLQRVDGSNPINLTEDSPASDHQPAFSPDGSQIAFRSDRDGGGLYVMGATGEAVRRITDSGYDPAWSPDGTRIAFATEGVDSPLERFYFSGLWVVDLESGDKRKIQTGDAVQPSWSPDGQRIAFWTARIGEGKSGQRDLFTVRPDGSDLVEITDDLAVDWRPQWSADGRHLYFASDRGGSMNLWRIPIDPESSRAEGEMEPLTTPSLWSGPFALSGDGSRIAYVARDDRSRLVAVAFDPEKGELAGEPITITQGALLVSSWEVSPDGDWIALTNRGRQEDVYLLRPDGSGLRKLTDDIHKDRGVSWLDDERLIIYSTRGGGYELWTIRRDGSDMQAITETTGQSMWLPKASADGKRLLAHNWEGTYIFEIDGPRPLRKEGALHLNGLEGDEAFRGQFWTLDGTRILGEAGESLATTVAVHDFGDGSVRLFESPRGATSKPAGWLPDGRRFLATADGSVWLVDADSGVWEELPLRIEGNTAKLTNDARWLHYVETTTQADIWVARLE